MQYDTPTTAAPESNALTGEEKRVLWLTSPCHMLTHMFILVFPAVTIPIMTTLNMPLEQVVRLSFFMYLTYGIGAIPAGYVADRWGAKKLLVVGVYLMGAGTALAGLFPSASLMPAALMLVGLGASVYHPAGLALISHTVRKRGYAMGINGVFGNIGIAMAPLVTGILTWLFSWQKAFIILGATSVVTGLLISLIRVDESPHPVHASKKEGGGEYVKYFLILCFALMMGGLAYRGNTVLLPAYLEIKAPAFETLVASIVRFKPQGTATLAATVLTSFVFLFGIVGQLIGGRVADRYDLRYAYLAVHAASLPFLFGMAFTTDYMLAFCAGAYVLFSLGMQPIENSLIAALTPAKWRGVAYAIKFVAVFGVGATSVYLVGIVKMRTSLEGVYIFLGGLAFLLVVSIMGLSIASRHIRHIRN